MSNGTARFAARYPVVWHVIEADGAGPWLTGTGLLPSAELLRLAGRHDDGRNRDTFATLSFGGDRVAVIRPQLMPDARLRPTLAGSFAGRPEAWRRHINSHVFFWTDATRRDAFIRACARLRGSVPPLVLVLETAALLRRAGDRAYFSRFNTGSTVRGGGRVRRDDAALSPVSGYRSGPVAELAVRGPVTLEGLKPVVAEPDP